MDSLHKLAQNNLARSLNIFLRQSPSTYTEMAANDLMFDGSNSAKLKLELAIRDMAYSAVEDCTKASDIALTKNELQKIHDVIP